MTPRISVLCVTRGRVKQFQHMLGSLLYTAADPDAVEVVVRCDQDDIFTIDYLRTTLSFSFIVGPRLKGYATLPTLTNQAARLSTAPLVIVVNDDCEFVTPGWDVKLRLAADLYPDGIFDLGVDTLNAGNFVFPCVSRRQMLVLGGMLDERLVYPDIWLRDVLQPFGRAIRVPDVTIAHHWDGRSPDQEQALQQTLTPEYQALYAQCVAEGQAKIEAVLTPKVGQNPAPMMVTA